MGKGTRHITDPGEPVDKTILERLRHAESPVSGQSLARELGISRVALWKRMEGLKAWGYRIEAGRRGYALVRDDGLSPVDLPPPVRVLPRVSSTMDAARDWGWAGAPSGAALLALSQRSGRGRGGRTWESPDGGLYLSLILRSALPAVYAGALVLEAARTLLEVLGASGIRGASFRWPNDVTAGSRKLGGILVDSFGGLDRPDFYVLGIGLNTASVEIPGRGTAGLEQLSERVPRRRDLAASLAESLRVWCASPDTNPRRWEGLTPDPLCPARAELWDGRIRKLRPRGYTARGELSCYGFSLAYGECRKMSYEGEEP